MDVYFRVDTLKRLDILLNVYMHLFIAQYLWQTLNNEQEQNKKHIISSSKNNTINNYIETNTF